MEKEEKYRGCTISWQEPPRTSAEWVVNVASNDRHLQERIGKSAKVMSGQSWDEVIAKAKEYVDGLLK